MPEARGLDRKAAVAPHLGRGDGLGQGRVGAAVVDHLLDREPMALAARAKAMGRRRSRSPAGHLRRPRRRAWRASLSRRPWRRQCRPRSRAPRAGWRGRTAQEGTTRPHQRPAVHHGGEGELLAPTAARYPLRLVSRSGLFTSGPLARLCTTMSRHDLAESRPQPIPSDPRC